MTLFRKILLALFLCVPLATFATPTASSLDGQFVLKPDPDVYESDTLKHVTVKGELRKRNDVAWYSFTGQAGQRFFADHDDGINGDTLTDSVLSLFDARGNLLATSDDSDADPGSPDNGTGFFPNAFLGAYNLRSNGVYYLAVTASGNGIDDTVCTEQPILLTQPVTDGIGGSAYSGCKIDYEFVGQGGSAGTFTLHVSLDGIGGGMAVPEPGSLSLAGAALAGLMARRRRQG